MDNNEITVFTGETLPEKREMPQNAMQMRSQFVAAMRVPVPRNEEKVLETVKKIAEKRGHRFFYLWPVKNKDGFNMITGGTIDLAETLLYYWTNYAIEDEIQDLGDRWKLKHIFIDFERGIQRPRTTIIFKPKDIPGTWDKDRWERMIFNKASSYNIRDLVFSVIPRWIKDEIIEAAKIAEIKRAEVEFDKDGAMNLFTYFKTEYGLNQADILDFLNISKLTKDNYFKVKNILAQLKRGDIQANNILKGISKEKKQSVKSEEKPKETPFNLAIKSLELREISEIEICAYFDIEDLKELDCEQGIADLQKIVNNIESETMAVEEFKKIGAERFEMRMKEKK